MGRSFNKLNESSLFRAPTTSAVKNWLGTLFRGRFVTTFISSLGLGTDFVSSFLFLDSVLPDLPMMFAGTTPGLFTVVLILCVLLLVFPEALGTSPKTEGT